MPNRTSILVTALGKQLEAFASDLGDDQSHYLYYDAPKEMGTFDFDFRPRELFAYFFSILLQGSSLTHWRDTLMEIC